MKLDDISSTATALATISDAEGRLKVTTLVSDAQKKLNQIREDCLDQRQSVDNSQELLARFELVSENMSSWLRDVESHIRNESVNQVALDQLESKIEFIRQLDADIENHQSDVKEVKELADKVSFMFQINFFFVFIS